MSSVAPRFPQRASIPDRLQDLLVREAAFILSRKRISDALQIAHEQKTAAGGGRPLLSFLFKDSKKESQRREIVENVSVMEAGIQKIDAAFPTLEACVERSLENYLREHDYEYVNGLGSSRFLDDWHRLLARFDQTVADFVLQLTELKGAFETLPATEPCGSNSEARKSITKVVATARALQDEISFVNKIADAQRIRAGTEAITLYRQPERNWKGTAHSLLFTMPGPAIATVILLLNESNEMGERVRGAIQGECQLASYVVQYGVTSYHQRVWASLREAATLRIDPATLEATLTDTEEKMERGLLEPWIPARAELLVETGNTTPRTPSSPLSPATASQAASAVPSAPPPNLRNSSSKAPSLRLPSRNGSPPKPADPDPSAAPPSSQTEPVPGSVPISPSLPESVDDLLPKEAADTVADLAAERIRLKEILKEERLGIEEREQFLSKSEERLLQKTQEQIERETELEQREEQLRDLEKRLREKLGAGAFPFTSSMAAATASSKPFDEFNE